MLGNARTNCEKTQNKILEDKEGQWRWQQPPTQIHPEGKTRQTAVLQRKIYG